VPLIL